MKRKFTQSMLDKIYKELLKGAAPVQKNKKGVPVYYRIILDCTDEEYRAIKEKLRSMR